jgi:hypothetical protein
MTVSNCKFYQLQLLKQWLCQAQDIKQALFFKLITTATDQSKFDQLTQDLQYFIEIEKSVVMKILKFHSFDPSDFVITLDLNAFK